ncbi:hypothetical protein J3A64_004735 [Pseudarthrobacter sp. PvP004]|nr:cutinase family protein [Pseudarthrobacter sp. PvP004]MBP2269195.1 hypothetical protein [Pseudarthrobacter sp. PvP004]
MTTTQQFYKEMAWLASMGISTGWTEANGSRSYRALTTVNRDAMAAFMYRFNGSLGSAPVPPVSGVTAVASGPTAAVLSWTNPSSAGHAGVMIRRTAGNTAPAGITDGTLVTELPGTTTTYTNTGLTASTTYSYSVFAKDTQGKYAAPAKATVTTIAAPVVVPPVPGVTAVASGPTAAVLSWTNPSSAGHAGVMIRRTAGNTAPAGITDGTLVTELPGTTTTYTNTGLTASTTYSYSVFAKDIQGKYAAPAKATVTTIAAPDNCSVPRQVVADISQDTVWGASCPEVVLVKGMRKVSPGVTLTIQPGTVVKFHYTSSLSVDGSLVVNGTAAAPVTFTSFQDDTAGGDTNGDAGATKPAINDWSGLTASDTGSVSVTGLSMRYAASVLNGNGPQKVSILKSMFTDCGIGIEVNRRSGYEHRLRSMVINGNTLTRSGSISIRSENDEEETVPVQIKDNTVTGASAGPYFIRDVRLRPSNLTGNTGSGNKINAIQIAGKLIENWTMPTTGLPYLVSSWTYSSLRITDGVTLTIQPGTVVKFHYTSSLSVDGSLVVNGTAAAPVTFTSFQDDTAGGDTNGDAGATKPAINDWSGLTASDTGSVSVTGLSMRYAASVLNGNGPQKVSILKSMFTDCGIGIEVNRRSGYEHRLRSMVINGNTLTRSGSISIRSENDEEETVPVQIKDNTVTGASAGPYFIRDVRLRPSNLTGNTGSGNKINAIQIAGKLIENWTMPTTGLPYLVSSWTYSSLRITDGVTLTIQPGTVVKFHYTSSLSVDGSLVVNGTAAAPVTFTSFQDDTAGGDTNGDAGATKPAINDWSGLTASDTGSVSVTGLSMRYAASVLNGNGPQKVSILKSMFTDCGIGIEVNRRSGYEHRLRSMVINGNTLTRSGSISIRSENDEEETVPVQIKDNTVTGASAGPYFIRDVRLRPSNLTGNTGSGNKINAIQIAGKLIENWTMPTTGLPYLVSSWTYSSLRITDGVTLTIQPGTVVKFHYTSSLSVDGSLVVNGTAAAPVTFTSFQDDTAGGDTNGDAGATKPAINDWSGLTASDTGSVSVTGLSMRYAASVLNGNGPQKVSILKSMFTDCGIGIEVNRRSGYEHRLRSMVINGNTLTRSGSISIRSENDEEETVPVQIKDNTVTGASAGPYFIRDVRLRPSNLTGNTGSGNKINAIQIAGKLIENWTMPTTGLPYLVSSWTYSSLRITDGVTLTIQPGTVVKFHYTSSLSVDGSLVVNGTAAAPVTFTSFQDDTAGGDTNGDAGATKPAINDWSGLTVTGALKAQHLVVKYASQSVTGQPDYSNGNPPPPLLELDHVRLESAVTCLTTGNDVRGHFHGAVANCATGVESRDPFDATNVEWGGGRGPGPENGNPSMGGSAVSVYPWVGVVLPPKPTTLPAAQAANVCKQYLFIGVMGSGQRGEANNTDLLGSQVRAIQKQFSEEVGADKIATLGLDYPAFPVPIVEEKSLQGIAQYVPGAWQGSLSLIWEIEQAAERCPDQKIVLAGYSQGAWVIHAAVNYMAAAQSPRLQHVKGVSLLADPLRKSSDFMHHFGTATTDATGVVNLKIGNVTVGMHDWMNGVVKKMYPELSDLEAVKMSLGGYPGSFSGPTISICDHQDPVCAFTLIPPGIDFAVHTSYGPTDYLLLGRKLAQLMA